MARNPMARSPRKTASAPRAKRCLNNPDQNHIDSLQPRFAFARPGLVPSPPQTPPARRPTIWISRPDASTGRDPGILPPNERWYENEPKPAPESLAPAPSENGPKPRPNPSYQRPAKTNPSPARIPRTSASEN